MKIVPVADKGGEEAYQAFLSSHPASMLYYTLAYRNLIRDHLVCEANYFVAVDDSGSVRGCLPTMARDGCYGRVLNSLAFFGSHGGVLANSPAAEAALWEHWNRLAADAAAATVILNPLGDQHPPVTWTHSAHRMGSVTTLPERGTVESVLSGVESSARRNYQKAARLGLEVSEANDAIDVLHEIHRENMSAIGGRVKDLTFFRAIPRHFVPGQDFRIYIATQGAAVISALLIFLSGRCVEYFTPGTRLAYRELQSSALLLVRAMQDAVNAGYRLWNWGGSSTAQNGVARFKEKWGGVQRPYQYLTVVNVPEVLAASTEELSREYANFYVVPFTDPGSLS